MCLAIPGQLVSIEEKEDPLLRVGAVSFDGIRREVSLAYVPEAKAGDYVLVHVGFALKVVDEAEALQTFQYLKQIEALDEIAEG